MKVLIAEDDLHIREGLEALLQADGYQTIAACDGRDALRLFKSDQPDFVLLDIMMPGLNGYDVCREIRRCHSNVPVIFVSAKSEEIDRVVGLELGADDFIMKPFGTKEVIARIRAVTRRCLNSNEKQPDVADRALESMQEFTMGDLRIAPRELRAWRGKELIELSLRDARILATLAERRGQVVPREQLYRQCWGRAYLPNSRTLDQHMSKLRKAIEVDPKNPRIIHTVHGVGYRFDE